ncbi:asparagine synthase-related protein [Streptomyces sp. NPDC026672]|uniref:asparagine synthase-related protein n=1 Tax=unclassified Streptomyces TaxID=2593676 RepID=UPI0033E72F4F
MTTDFLILPDCDGAAGAARRAVTAGAGQVVPHASGRPWLVPAGPWGRRDLTLVSAGDRRLGVVGRTRLDPDAVTRALGRARSPYDLDAVACALPGGVHLSVSFDGRTRSQGSVSTARQLFLARVDGVTVAATTPRPLTALTGAVLDEETLALQLVNPVVPWPLALRTLWTGVTQLPSGHWLETGPDGAHRTVPWWQPPAAELPLEEAADGLREALRDALAVRAGAGDGIGADLSGGLDSTSLCFLAAESGARLLTHHWRPRDRGNDDTVWARRAAERLPHARHEVFEAREAPGWFAHQEDPHGLRDDVEGLSAWNRNRTQMEHLARLDAADGCDVHLIGLGGDELFGVIPTYLWTLVRRSPMLGLRVVRRHRAVNRWRAGATLRGLADRSTFADSLARAADLLQAPQRGAFEPALEWGFAPRLPSWATPDAVGTVRRLLREAADGDPAPLGPDRLTHQILELTVLAGCTLRQMRLGLAPFGVEWDAPYLDDRVVEAALSVRVQDRVTHGRYKPVLGAALRGVVPEEILQRRSKGEYTAEVYDGLRRNRRSLVGLCDDLRLARLGLVDADRLRAALLALGPESRHVNPFYNTLAQEVWLRSPSATADLDGVPAGDPR